ncbi:MAG TPA: hypothetical protein VNV66_07650 [Pilimelia sp.]|nr:hypothetical protein [Pilimelia sp.]
MIEPPLITFDDDQYMYVYESVESLSMSVEWPFVDEVVGAYDARGFPLRLDVVNEVVTVGIGVASILDHHRMRALADQFFRLWTYTAAPDPTLATDKYIQELLRRYRVAKIRRRKRKSATQ